ncbi:MAG: LysR family transcriptional regulator [Rhizobiaceae bacterium]|nr:LysR family transcriptional regulator [Rhizobiaceae bacterium]MCV0407576.1 LysR family transcriptional regulator [Rhizobiaceae bacterium]
MRPFPNLRHVRLFAHAVELASLSKAAEAVRITQPAASQAIAKLERFFGGPLFERRGGGVFATERGRMVAVRAGRALDLLRQANQRLARQSRIGRALAQDLLETHATIAHLRALAAFARTGSFSAAARLLDQAEPSVQRAARELERIGGVPLFDGRQAVRLTPTGMMLAGSASLVLKELESASEEVGELDGRFDGRIVVGTLPLVRTRVVPRAVADWTRKRPGASIEIVDGSYDLLLHGLSIGEIDMLVGALRASPPPRGLDQRPLFEDGLSIIARAGHPLTARTTIDHAELFDYPWVLPRRGTPSRAIFEQFAAESGAAADRFGIIETGSLVVLRGILTESDRLTILSRRQIAHEERSGLLKVLPVDLARTERTIGISTRSGWKPTLLQSEFLDALDRAGAERDEPSPSR